MKPNVSERIDAYLEERWETIVADINKLVSIESIEDAASACDKAPFGAGPRAALDAMLSIAAGMGFSTHDVDGYLGYADYPGGSDVQMGIIGHVDVVPAGPGWTVPPFQVTRREGYLMGRGVIDDKGPSVVALHALNFWKEQGVRFPCSIRFLFGANEESGMADVKHYRERYEDPAFLFTPDAEFPVCYGEKGIYNATVTSPPFPDGVIVDFRGGVATNAVPGEAYAIVRADAATLPDADRITVTAVKTSRFTGKIDTRGEIDTRDEIADGGEAASRSETASRSEAASRSATAAKEVPLARIDAVGKSAHASLPETGISAISLLVDYLIEQNLCTDKERAFLEFERKIVGSIDGSGIGVSCSDEHFGNLTLVGGTVRMENGRIAQSIDSRFPTSITAERITERLAAIAAESGATCEQTSAMDPFLVDPESPMIGALLNAYNEATGENARPFTMGGGTYARHFSSAASFGPEKPWETAPEWAGSMHGPDESVSEELLKQAFRIYALTIPRLCDALSTED